MQNGEFEKKIQQKMEELHFTPSAAVWDSVELSLPEKEKRRRWIFFLLLFGFLAAGFLLWHKYYGSKQNNITAETAIKTNTKKNEDSKIKNDENKKVTESQNLIDTNSTVIKKTNTAAIHNKPAITNSKHTTTIKNNIGLKAAVTKIKTKASHANTIDDKADPGIATPHRNQQTTKQKTSIKVKAPVTTNEEEKNTETTNDVVSIDTVNNTTKIAIVKPIPQNIVEVDKKIEKDSSIIKKDTSLVVAKKSDKKKKITKWQYGIAAAGGISKIKTGLFDNSSQPLNYVSGPSNPLGIIPPSTPTQSLGFSFGFYLEKELTNHWKFTTGLNYVYQSNVLKVGAKQDSFRVFNFAYSSIATTQGYYVTGNESNYKNKFHLFEIPLQVEYKVSRKLPFYLQAGPTIGYLLQSNALVYNANYNEYFTDKKLFNKLLLSFGAGVGINLAQKTKQPFSIGYRFKYGVSSIVKTSFGEEHFLNSLLYLKIPLKK